MNTAALACAMLGMTPDEAHFVLAEGNYRRTLAPSELRAYRIHLGEIVATCPHCGTVDAPLDHDNYPDMVGTTYVTTALCCGKVIASANDGLEYDAAGNIVDIS